MSNRGWLLPLIGVLSIVVLIVGFAVSGEPPDTDEGAQEAVDFYLDNEGSVMAGSVIQGVAAALFVFFGGILRVFLREAEGARPVLSAVAFGGLVIFAVGMAIDATINFALAEEAENIDPVATHALVALWSNDFLPFAVGLLTFMIATGIVIVRTGVLPQWLGWAAIVVAITIPTPIGFVGFIGSGLFVIIISVVMAMQARNSGAARPAPTAP
jgi:hypothetical protein